MTIKTRNAPQPDKRAREIVIAQPAPEKSTQFTLTMRESLHRSLALIALENHMTMRGFIMQALRDAGLPVEADDLVDRRRR